MGDLLATLAIESDRLGAQIKLFFDTEAVGTQTVILTLFVLINSVRIFAYLPQIVRATRDSNGCAAISVWTWAMFLASHATTIAYSVTVLGDLVMAVIFLGNAAACFLIVAVTVIKRRRYARSFPVQAAE